MFPDWYRCETQVIVTVYSSDQEHDGDFLGAVAASAALGMSDIPFEGPIAEVRVGRVDGQLVINPTFSQLVTSDMDITVAGTSDSIVMVEGESSEISEAELLAALEFAHGYIGKLCDLQLSLIKETGLSKRKAPEPEEQSELQNEVRRLTGDRLKTLANTPLTKEDRAAKTDEIYADVTAALAEKYPTQETGIKTILHDMEYVEMREMILRDKKRLDGRGLSDIRNITIEIGLLPRTHGSSLFQRGETQSLTTMTLGTKLDEQIIDGLLPDSTKKFMLHYNFPPSLSGKSEGWVRLVGVRSAMVIWLKEPSRGFSRPRPSFRTQFGSSRISLSQTGHPQWPLSAQHPSRCSMEELRSGPPWRGSQWDSSKRVIASRSSATFWEMKITLEIWTSKSPEHAKG